MVCQTQTSLSASTKKARLFLLFISSELASNFCWTGLDIKTFHEKPTDYGEISSTWLCSKPECEGQSL
jgi:hypothetical protein